MDSCQTAYPYLLILAVGGDTQASDIQQQEGVLVSADDIKKFSHVESLHKAVTALLADHAETADVLLRGELRLNLFPSRISREPMSMEAFNLLMLEFFDGLRGAAESIRVNARSAQPLPLRHLPKVTDSALRMLKVLARAGAEGATVPYYFGGRRLFELPVLTSAELTDVGAPERLSQWVEGRIEILRCDSKDGKDNYFAPANGTRIYDHKQRLWSADLLMRHKKFRGTIAKDENGRWIAGDDAEIVDDDQSP